VCLALARFLQTILGQLPSCEEKPSS
jgi:hypothetical protein